MQDYAKLNEQLEMHLSLLRMKLIPFGQPGALTRILLSYFTTIRGDGRSGGEVEAALRKQVLPTQEHLMFLFDGANRKVLKYFFGNRADTVRDLWVRSFEYPYTSGWYRRPVRTKLGTEAHLGRVGDFIYELIRLDAFGIDITKFLKNPYEHIDINYGDFLYSVQMANQIAVEIDSGNEKVFQRIQQIINEEQSKICHTILLALVMSKSRKSHELCGMLLLAAKNQEGLRQSITEVMDRGCPEAFKFLVELILSEQLYRFSSVIRAFDVWSGLPISAEKPETVKHYLQLIIKELGNRAPCAELKNPIDFYIHLTCRGFYEIQDGLDEARDVLNHNDWSHKAVVYYWLSQIQWPQMQYDMVADHLDEKDPMVLAFLLLNLHNLPANWDKVNLFSDLHKLLAHLPAKKRTYQLPGMEGVKAELSASQILTPMLNIAHLTKNEEQIEILCGLIDQMDADLRYQFLMRVLPKLRMQLRRSTLLKLASDKSVTVRAEAYQRLKKIKLTEEEIIELEKLLRYKSEDLRKNIIAIICNRESVEILESIGRLVKSDDSNCVRAAEQIVQDIRPLKVHENIYQQAVNLLNVDDCAQNQSPELETYLPGDEYRITLDKPIPVLGGVPSDQIPNITSLKTKLNILSEWVKENSMFEYESESWDGSTVKKRFGQETHLQPVGNSDECCLENYPLGSLFRKCLEDQFSREELWRISFLLELPDYFHGRISGAKAMQQLYGVFDIEKRAGALVKIPYLYSHIVPLLRASIGEASDDEIVRVAYPVAYQLADMSTDIDLLTHIKTKYDYDDIEELSDWQYTERFFGCHPPISYWAGSLSKISTEHPFFPEIFRLEFAYTQKMKYLTDYYLPPEHVAAAFEQKIISESDLLFLLTRKRLTDLMHKYTYKPKNENLYREKYPNFYLALNKLIDYVIDCEIMRGELPAPLTKLASEIRHCYGMNHFCKIVSQMNQRNFVRGYNFPGSTSTKGETLSHLLKHLYPAEGDTPELMSAKLKEYNLGEQELIDAAMYSPQWLEYLTDYFGIPEIKKAGHYFHAHLNDWFDKEKESTVARYSAIPPADFQAGAFDLDWFQSSLQEVGETFFTKLYNAAKYIAGGGLHKRSQLFADAARGKLEKEELWKSAHEKRNKDSLLAYTLIPIKNEDDAIDRYLKIEQFKKESQQFGAQRRQSESRTAQIGIENLARNAGYVDTTRFVWQMETRELERISCWFEPQNIEGTMANIAFDEEGVPEFVCANEGKKLKSIPTKIRKHELVLQMQQAVKSLKAQRKRAFKSMENAMINRDIFHTQELNLLKENPVLEPLLSRLLFVSNQKIGFYQQGKLEMLDGKVGLNEEDEMLLAHPVDFIQSSEWPAWQRYFCEKQIRQPFKQLFREFYAPTKDELSEKGISRRYAGHQIQTRKAWALASARNWSTVDGLFKVYHKHHIAVELYAGYVDFTPADTEPQTIEQMTFYNTNTGKVMDIGDIPSVLFSEAMRDVDLIVSVAHYGEVDPEASHSTIEMRRGLVQALLPLLKLDNVSLDNTHANIRGHFGEYSVHMGSGVVHMMAKGMMPLVPVHSGQRGRIFLPFADDDPKTAEILSIVLLLADDQHIKDPGLLKFIQSN